MFDWIDGMLLRVAVAALLIVMFVLGTLIISSLAGSVFDLMHCVQTNGGEND
jgi:hypothetical protein